MRFDPLSNLGEVRFDCANVQDGAGGMAVPKSIIFPVSLALDYQDIKFL